MSRNKLPLLDSSNLSFWLQVESWCAARFSLPSSRHCFYAKISFDIIDYSAQITPQARRTDSRFENIQSFTCRIKASFRSILFLPLNYRHFFPCRHTRQPKFRPIGFTRQPLNIARRQNIMRMKISRRRTWRGHTVLHRFHPLPRMHAARQCHFITMLSRWLAYFVAALVSIDRVTTTLCLTPLPLKNNAHWLFHWVKSMTPALPLWSSTTGGTDVAWDKLFRWLSASHRAVSRVRVANRFRD